MDVNVEYDPDDDTYRTVHDFSADVPLSATVVLAIEQVADDLDDDLDDVLYDAVDPDALDAIFTPVSDVAPYRRGHVEFAVSDLQIMVRSDGVVEIDPSGGDEDDS